jgi:hypothetical protein
MIQESFSITDKRKTVDLKKTESVENWLEFSADSSNVPAFISYTDDFVGWVERAPRMNSPHPDYPALRLKKCRGERQEGFLVKVSLWYESWSVEASYPGRVPNSKPITRKGGEVSVSEEGLLTHKYYQNEFTEEQLGALNEYLSSDRTKKDYDDLEQKLQEGEPAQEALAMMRKGIEAYLNPQAIHTEKLTGVKIEAFDLSKIGKIDEPPDAPAIGDRTWLYLGASYDENDDGTYSGIRRWQASEDGGWNVKLYGSNSPPAAD